MRSIESSGKTVDEAIFRGLQELEISIDEVNIEIIRQETKGILGIGAKHAIVKLTEKTPEDVEVPDFKKQREFERREPRPARTRDQEPKKQQRDVPPTKKVCEPQRVAEPAVQEVDKKVEREAEKPKVAPKQRPPAQERREKPTERKQTSDSSNGYSRKVQEGQDERPMTPEPEYSLEAAANNPGAKFLSEAVRLMGISGKVLAATEQESLMLKIESDSNGLLIGHRGETLDALQYITSLVVNKDKDDSGYKRVAVDTENYRRKREETLVKLARRVASQVRATGRSKALEPMNPYERRILHFALQNNHSVSTHSEGEEPNRRVIISPRRRGGYNNNRSNSAE